MRALRELGYEVDVLAFPLGEPVEMTGVRVFRTANPLGFRSVPIGFSLRKAFLDLLLWRQLAARLDRDRYVAVHAVEEAAFLAALLRRRRGPFLTYDMASSMPEQLGQRFPFRNRVAQAIGRRLEGWLLRNVDYVICSSGLGDHVSELAPGTSWREWCFPSRVATPATEEVESLRLRLGLNASDRAVVYAGSFADYQGVPILLGAIGQVCAEVPQAAFVLVGASQGAEREKAIRSVPERYRGRVRILPRVDNHGMAGFLGLAEVLVSPRVHGHNLPLKIFDYLHSGKPIVATDIPAHTSLLDDELADLVEPDPGSLARGIIRVLTDPGRASALSAAARAFASAHLTWDSFVASLQEVLALATDSETANGEAPGGRRS